MSHRAVSTQIFFLFIGNLVIYTTGMGLLPLLPLYATQFGASQAFVGIFFAIIYLSNMFGHLFTGWIVERIPRRTLFTLAATLGVPALLLLGRATSLWQVVVLASVLWFSGGVDASLIGIFTGLHASEKSRGKSFSLMSVAVPLGALTGGILTGFLIAWQGYSQMFTWLAGMWAMLPLIGVFTLKDNANVQTRVVAPTSGKAGVASRKSIYFVLVFSFFFATAININQLGRSFSMQALDFSPQFVASTATISGLFTIPVLLLTGILSDRLGRTRFLFVTYALAMGGSLVLATAHSLWQFWMAATLALVASTTNSAMTYALVTDRLASGKFSRALSFLNATSAMAGILSFSLTGYAMERLGHGLYFLIASLLPVAAAIFLKLFLSEGQRVRPARRPAQMEAFFSTVRMRNQPVSPELSDIGC